MNELSELMNQAAGEMRHSLAKTRAALSHNLSRGEAAEESFRAFLRKHLPDSLGVTKGQILDSKGGRSRQLDVIIYNKSRTPMLFTSDEGDQQLVPSEGAIAVVEIKTSIRAADVEGIVANMQSVKTLDKTAYYGDKGVSINTFNMYGQELKVFPTLFFVFAYEGANLGPLAAEFQRLNGDRPVACRIDGVCILDSGIIMHHRLNEEGDSQFDIIASPSSTMMAYLTSNALLLWYLMFSRYVLQAHSKAINLQAYVPADFIY
jgi:hypothetical protein